MSKRAIPRHFPVSTIVQMTFFWPEFEIRTLALVVIGLAGWLVAAAVIGDGK